MCTVRLPLVTTGCIKYWCVLMGHKPKRWEILRSYSRLDVSMKAALWMLCHRWPLLVRTLHCNTPMTPPAVIYTLSFLLSIPLNDPQFCTVRNNQHHEKVQNYECTPTLSTWVITFFGYVLFCRKKSFSPAERCVISFLASVQSIYSPEVYLEDNKSPHITFALNQPTT